MTDYWHGYFVAQWLTANLNENNWVTLVDLLDQIIGNGNNADEQQSSRGAVDGFWWDTGEVDAEDEPILKWYSNLYIYRAKFNEEAVKFDKFVNRLETVFEVAPGSVTYTAAHNPIGQQRYRPSVVASFKFGASNRIRVALMGCASDATVDLCSKKESNEEVLQMLADNPAVWGEVVV